MFAEPDRNTSKPVVNRWLGRADAVPFFFAGIWRERQGDVSTIKAPDVGCTGCSPSSPPSPTPRSGRSTIRPYRSC